MPRDLKLPEGWIVSSFRWILLGGVSERVSSLEQRERR